MISHRFMNWLNRNNMFHKLVRVLQNTLVLILLSGVFSCKNDKEIIATSDDYHKTLDKLTEIMIHDIFSPPVASRIYNYPNIAAYEIISLQSSDYKSLSGQLSDFTPVPKPDTTKQINYKVAALVAYMDVAKHLIFSEDRMEAYRDSIYTNWKNVNKKGFEDSKDYGLKVATHIKEWLSQDNYAQTRTMPKFTVDSENHSRWQPTPPDYMDGIEPHWNKIRPMVLKSSDQFTPDRHPEFSLEKDSPFFKEVMETYEVGAAIKKEGETSEKLEIAKFWDCNPYVSTHKGHLMFATKKITPGAHWIGICKIACQKAKTDFEETVYAYTKTSIAIVDAFISCWDEKYRSNLIRPETLINQHIDENWAPVLQTPPFPEFTSGHSVVSGAASTVLTDIFGNDFSFEDTTELPYGLPMRSFPSFDKAAEEAAISRLYGGIHYRSAIDLGLKQGRSLGNYVLNNLDMKTNQKEIASK